MISRNTQSREIKVLYHEFADTLDVLDFIVLHPLGKSKRWVLMLSNYFQLIAVEYRLNAIHRGCASGS